MAHAPLDPHLALDRIPEKRVWFSVGMRSNLWVLTNFNERVFGEIGLGGEPQYGGGWRNGRLGGLGHG
jgi:hypothetical protein